MKLITLNNKDNAGRFTTYFQEPITLREKSKVALLNASLNMSENVIEINATNKRITLNIGKVVPYTFIANIDLTEGIYTRKTITEELMNKLNSLPINTSTNGLCFNVSLVDEKINITFGQQPATTFGLDSSRIGYERGMKDVTLAGNKVLPHSRRKSTKLANAYNAALLTKFPFINGVGRFRAEFTGMSAPPAADDMINSIIGLTTISNLNTPPYDSRNYVYGVMIQSATTGNYYLPIKDGIVQPPSTNIVYIPGDIVKLILVNGALSIVYERAGATRQIASFPYKFSDAQILYGMITLYQTEAAARGIYFTQSPFFTEFNETIRYSLNAGDGLVRHNNQPDDEDGELGADIDNFIELVMNVRTVKLLGFTKSPTPLNGQTGTFKADKIMLNENLPNNIKILLEDGLIIESYDGLSGLRENILISLPSVNYVNTNIEYSREQPIFIDIGNLKAITLNRITVRIVDFQNNEIEPLPYEANLTLLFD